MIIINTVLNIVRAIYQVIKLAYFRARWRSINQHNHTVVENIFDLKNISVGEATYGLLTVYRWSSEGEGLRIGNYCSIASGVKFILGGNHATNMISTYPFAHYFEENQIVAETKGPIVVEDDVWVGTDVTILSGITIGKGAVIAAGSMIIRDVPPYAIMGGNPAKVLRFRLCENDIDNVRNLDLSALDDQTIRVNLSLLKKPVSEITPTELAQLTKTLQRKN